MNENYVFYGCIILLVIIFIKHIITPKNNNAQFKGNNINLKRDLFGKTNHLVRYLV